jgi:hypothetical protein
VYEGVGQYPVLPELPLFTLERGESRSLDRPVAADNKSLDDTYAAGYLCIEERWSGGGSWKVRRLEVADWRAVKPWAVSIVWGLVEDDGEVYGDGGCWDEVVDVRCGCLSEV